MGQHYSKNTQFAIFLRFRRTDWEGEFVIVGDFRSANPNPGDVWSLLQWVRSNSNFVGPAEWPKPGLLNSGFGSSFVPRTKRRKLTQSSFNFRYPEPEMY